MTRRRADSHSTEFGLWLRNQKELDSSFGFVATNIDYLWENHKTGQWMIIEEKRYNSMPSYSQSNQFKRLVKRIISDKFKGFHYLRFEKTGPEDGKIYLDDKEINKDMLLKFLAFKHDDRIERLSI